MLRGGGGGGDEKLFLFSKFCTLLSIPLFCIVHFAPMFGVDTVCVCVCVCNIVLLEKYRFIHRSNQSF